ncbi:MAG: type II toxin-antitoxin system prevent-host-death family antitoxin [Candidatus Poribacteria bacterium]|nr:type II toxin-antitoxin system prevent-host-death family antitoxin [Candidatus Poribacteria bacterium]
MELPIHEAKTRFSQLVKVVKSGERVVILESGEPVAELIRFEGGGGIDFKKLETTRKRLGLSGNREGWPQAFDDPKFSRQVLGLEEGD